MALKRGGEAVDDPRAWWDSLPSDVVTLWDAFYRLEPWGGEYQRHAAECELLESIFAKLINRDIPKDRRDLIYKPRQRRQFFPGDYAGESPKRTKASKTIGDQCEEYVRTIMSRRK